MVYLFLGTGFEEVEAVATIDVLRRAEVELTTVSVMNERSVEGAHGVRIEADKMFDEVNFSDVEMLILPGGMPGTLNLGAHEGLLNLLRDHDKKGRRIAAICAAPAVLGQLGILQGKQATCYPGFEHLLGESHVGGLVVESKNIITAKGPGLSSDFAFCIIEKLVGSEVADHVYDAAQY